MINHIDDEQIESLRKLRLWHWNRVINNRYAANWYRTRCRAKGDIEAYAKVRDKKADFHLKQVQVLNYFFATEVGDTAEFDAAKKVEQNA